MSHQKRPRHRLIDLVPQVILMRAEGRTLQEIGEVTKLTKQRISQVVKIAKRHEEIQKRWGFPFSVRTDRILDDLCIKSKDEALELYKSGHLYPGAIWSFGHKSYHEICEWLGVTPLSKRPKTPKNTCPHCGKTLSPA